MSILDTMSKLTPKLRGEVQKHIQEMMDGFQRQREVDWAANQKTVTKLRASLSEAVKAAEALPDTQIRRKCRALEDQILALESQIQDMEQRHEREIDQIRAAEAKAKSALGSKRRGDAHASADRFATHVLLRSRATAQPGGDPRDLRGCEDLFQVGRVQYRPSRTC